MFCVYETKKKPTHTHRQTHSEKISIHTYFAELALISAHVVDGDRRVGHNASTMTEIAMNQSKSSGIGSGLPTHIVNVTLYTVNAYVRK